LNVPCEKIQRRIAENRARIASLGIREAAHQLALSRSGGSESGRIEKKYGSRKNSGKKTKPSTNITRRRSRRVAGEEPELENAGDFGNAIGWDNEQMFTYKEEWYGPEHVRALGRAQKTWVLFQDGYDSRGNRVYDKAAGQTCHQCRQKTLGKRTACTRCKSMHGVFCGDCLYMRYGEHVDEARDDAQWTCPSCRDICNCSFCRSKKGWPPTGAMYRTAVAEGYPSVAHYLIMERRREQVPPPDANTLVTSSVA
jgi:hypothetical protein